MMSGIDFHAQTLFMRAKRAEILSNNLANADTPGYKAQDLSFDDLLNQQSVKMNLTTQGHMVSPNQVMGGELITRQTQAVQEDGNTVDSQKEIMAFTDNALKYQASLTFLNSKVRGILSAIKGE